VSGHGEKLTRKQEQAIAALLLHPTVREAAAEAKVGEATLRRWMKEPAFNDAYTATRRRLLEHGVNLGTQSYGLAAQKQQQLLNCGIPAVELRASVAIQEQTRAGLQVVDVAAQLEAIVRRLDELEGRKRGGNGGGGERGDDGPGGTGEAPPRRPGQAG
jgi:hypothetical protein